LGKRGGKHEKKGRGSAEPLEGGGGGGGQARDPHGKAWGKKSHPEWSGGVRA